MMGYYFGFLELFLMISYILKYRYIVSDCDSVGVMYDSQHYTATPEDAAADSIKAGLIYSQER